MKSNMTHSFSNAPQVSAPRSSFDRSFTHKSAFDAGYLIPYLVDDIIPGDTFTVNTTAFLRLSTPEFPFFDNLFVDTHFFFVPLRLVWENSRKFFGEQLNPGDSIDYTIPQFTSFTPVQNSLSDYMGLPTGNAMTPNSIYHRGYNLIWREWFRDQNLQDSPVVDTDDGPDLIADYTLLKRGKRHDYFTSALTAPQKGDAVTIPLGTTAPIQGDGNAIYVHPTGTTDNRTLNSSAGTTNVDLSASTATTASLRFGNTTDLTLTGLEANLTSATSATINDLREAFQVQKLLERDARSGTRYPELLRNHFGITDFVDLTYRPEFLGGGSAPINAQAVSATSSVADDLGGQGAYATGAFSGHGFTKSFSEHGFIIGLISTRADLTYSQGIPRHFLKQTRYDTYFPSLAHLGEQEITNAEIYHQNTSADDDIFGYQERYAEYRYKQSQLTAEMRPSHSLSLDPWHLSQEFGSLPILGDTFIQEDPPMSRILRSAIEPHFIMDSYTTMKCARAMPVYGVPGMIDHF